jgi:hypothetical protein
MQGSGGPIVDACGRAIGMNTYIAVDEQQSGRVSYALAAGPSRLPAPSRYRGGSGGPRRMRRAAFRRWRGPASLRYSG